MSIGEQIKAMRKIRGLTQKELAEKIGLNKTTYARYENGERRIPLKTAIRLAEFYHISLDYMAGLTDSTEYY